MILGASLETDRGSLQKQPCEERLRLEDQYRARTNEYSRSVDVLQKWLGMLKKQDYKEIREAMERARNGAERAKLALERHVAEHGC